ncbi:Glucose-1-phosphate adenylyltransferase [subsurface metagenome]
MNINRPKVLSVILGGGKGERLYPLTRNRAKPAVIFGGKYRLVDIPISNCINSGFKQIYVLTQYNSSSLHNHISHTYKFNGFSKNFIEIVAAEQTLEHSDWCNGTADAVRKHLPNFRSQLPSHYLILSGDQLYRMDLKDFFSKHIESGADISVAAKPVSQERASCLGIMKVDESGRILEFREKPEKAVDISDMMISRATITDDTRNEKQGDYLASMGIYIFNAGVLEKALENDMNDFGKDVIPDCINNLKVHSYIFEGFWEDIGTIKTFYEANINLTSITPDFNFYYEKKPIYTIRLDLPASKVNSCTIHQSLVSDGCIITQSTIINSIVGCRTIIESGAYLDGVVCLGAGYYETGKKKQNNRRKEIPDMGIGSGTVIKKSIIDKNARIGAGCRIGIDDRPRKDEENKNYCIKEGIIIVTKNAIIPEGTVI